MPAMKTCTKDMSQRIFILVVVLTSALKTSHGVCILAEGNGAIEINQWNGSIASPGFDLGIYPNFQDCTWNLKVSPGSRIQLTFEMFDLEEGTFINGPSSGAKTCTDYVTVKEASTEGALTILPQRCGSVLEPFSLTSLGSSLFIQFHSDESGAMKGFKASFTGVCEGDISEDTTLATPGYPNSPPRGVQCRWRLIKNGDVGVAKKVFSEGLDGGMLPRCGQSPFKFITSLTDLNGEEFCLTDSVQAYSQEIFLIYKSEGGASPWAGTIDISFINTKNCADFCVHSQDCQLIPTPRDSGRLDYICTCKDGYTGKNCEVPSRLVDPCEGNQNLCANGQCIALPELGKYTCDCGGRFTGQRCETPLEDGCSSQPCKNGAVCVSKGLMNYLCRCSQNGRFVGKHCDIPRDAPHCLEEKDDFLGSLITWTDSLAGKINIQPCPNGSIGNATRNCIRDADSPTQGFWTRPDLSMCVSPEIFQIAQDAQGLPDTRDTDLIVNITDRLLSATRWTENTPSGGVPTLYPGDLIVASSIISNVSDATRRFTMSEEGAIDLTEKYASTVDNLISPALMETWRNARANLVESQVSKMVAATQSLVTTLLPNIGLRQRRNVGYPLLKKYFQLTKKNLEITLSQARPDNKSLIHYQNFADSSSIKLPTSLLIDGHYIDDDAEVNIYFARFTSIAQLLSLAECRFHRAVQNDSNVINSDVVSLEIIDLPKSSTSNLRKPVVIEFGLQDANLWAQSQRQCVFMNMTADSYGNRWSTEGCITFAANDTHVTCHCYHLTNFAVLMDIYNNQKNVEEAHDIILSYISYIGGCLSIIASLVTIGTFQYFRLSSDRVRIHQQLGVAIILVQVMFICVSNTGEEHDTPLWSCRTVAILTHYSLTAMFSWMLVEGIHLYVVLVRVFKLGSHLKKYIAVGWGFPLVAVGISVGAFFDRYGRGTLCWLDQELLLVCFIPTVGLVLMINTVILIVVIRVMIRSNSTTHKISSQERSSAKMGLKAAVVLLPLLGLTWVLGFFTIDSRDAPVLQYIFTYLFTLANSCQGVLFFVFHCLLNADVHSAYDRRYKRQKRLSYIETTSSKLRKMSNSEFYNPQHSPGKSTTTTRSTLTDLSLGDHRPGDLIVDKQPIIIMDDLGSGRHLTSLWNRNSTSLIPAPDYPDDIQGMPFSPRSHSYPPSKATSADLDDANSTIILPRPHRNSVRFT